MKKVRIKNKKDKCLRCGGEFSHYSWDNQRFCSIKCINHKEKFECKCEVCGKITSRHKSNFDRNKHFYCSRECFDLRRTENLKHIKRHTKYYKDLISKSSCEDCGENKYYLLHIHHKDGNDLNNDPDNLEIVCSNCHIKRHLKYNKNGELVYHPSSLTDRSLILNL